MSLEMQAYATALSLGANLMSEDGENPEYDRGIVELIADMFNDGEDMETNVARVKHDLAVTRNMKIDAAFGIYRMDDVYDDNGVPVFLFVRRDHAGGLIVDDHRDIEGGTFNILLENRRGVPTLVVWLQQDFGNDPSWTIALRPPGQTT